MYYKIIFESIWITAKKYKQIVSISKIVKPFQTQGRMRWGKKGSGANTACLYRKKLIPSQTSSYFWSENTFKLLRQWTQNVIWNTVFNATVHEY